MSNDRELARLWKLQASVNKLIMDGKREAEDVSKALQRILEKTESIVDNSPLVFSGTIRVPAIKEPFIAKDKFVVNTANDAPIKICEIDDNFTTWFLFGDGKIEPPMEEQQLVRQFLREDSKDRLILKCLCYEEYQFHFVKDSAGVSVPRKLSYEDYRREFGSLRDESNCGLTTLTTIFALMMEDPKTGSFGVMDDGTDQVFYVRDSTRVIRRVSVRASDNEEGWGVYADHVESILEQGYCGAIYSPNFD